MPQRVNRIDSMPDEDVWALFLAYCTGSLDRYAAFYGELTGEERVSFDARVNAIARPPGRGNAAHGIELRGSLVSRLGRLLSRWLGRAR